MDDLRLELKIKNNRIFQQARVMLDKDEITQADIARHCKVTQAEIGWYLNFKISPLIKNTNIRGPIAECQCVSPDHSWSKRAIKIANALNVLPEYLWPEYFREARKNTFVAEMNAVDLLEALVDEKQILTPEERLVENETMQLIRSKLATLTPKEEKIIRMLFGIGEDQQRPMFVASDFGVSRTRLDQIKKKALRKLRHPSRAKDLPGYVNKGESHAG
jgi:RNA polymerase sigma factor (sigma-70 family)